MDNAFHQHILRSTEVDIENKNCYLKITQHYTERQYLIFIKNCNKNHLQNTLKNNKVE